MPSGFTSNTAAALIPNVGILKVDVSGTPTTLGLSRGGVRFIANLTLDNLPFDGKTCKIETLDRILDRNPVISGTFIEVKNTLWTEEYIEPGATEATAGTPTTVTVTPASSGTFLAEADYITNLDLCFDRGDGKDVIIRFPKAICTGYEIISQDPNGAEISAEWEARLDVTDAATSTDTAPFRILVIG